ncbi:MAG: response regulator [Desulforhopalus sp.]|nr:response regulator [Desulforhopalus sp.]
MAEIVILDDILDAAVLVQKILTRRGHAVRAFTEEDDFLSHLESSPVDLAILDLNLKKMSGLEVLEKIKRRKPRVRVIILTGFPTLESAKEAIALGAGAYCVKPVDVRNLEEIVAGELSRP